MLEKVKIHTNLPNRQDRAVKGKCAPSAPFLFITTTLPYNGMLIAVIHNRKPQFNHTHIAENFKVKASQINYNTFNVLKVQIHFLIHKSQT